MSCKVLVIPEDPTYNGAILAPLMSRVLKECGRPNAQIKVLTDPALNGIDHLRGSIGAIADRYQHFDLLIAVVDADGKDRTGLFQSLTEKAASQGARLLCAAAIQEVEVWLLAGHTEKLKSQWQAIRDDVSVKENVFEPFLRQYGHPKRPGHGRDLLMKQGLANFSGIIQRCPELAQLVQDITKALGD